MNHTLLLSMLLSLALAGTTTGCDNTKKSKPNTTKPADDKAAKPADDKATKPADDKATKPADDKAAKPAADKAAKPADDKAAKPADDKAAKPADDKAAKPADKDAGSTATAKDAVAAKGDAPPALVEDVASAKQAEAISDYMQQHFDELTRARNALIAGKLDGFKKHMLALAGRKAPKSAPANWAPHSKKMTEMAKAGTTVTDIASAATALGNAAAACASCHKAVSDTLRVLATGEAPAAANTLKSYMRRHVWAANEMWAGIMGPDDQAWAGAVKVLNETPLHKAPGASERWNKEALKLAQDVGALAKLGQASKAAQRPGIYGQFVATCASCHTALKAGPKTK